MPTDGWICNTCTLENDSVPVCNACGAERPQCRWSCHRCSYENDIVRRSCEMCEAPGLDHRENSSRGYVPAELLWRCKVCTLENTQSAKDCVACGTTKPSSEQFSAAETQCTSFSGHEPLLEDSFDEGGDATFRRGLSKDFSRSFSSQAPSTPGSISGQYMVDEMIANEFTAQETYEYIVRQCRTGKTVFTDEQFPPSPSSLGVLPRRHHTQVTQWLRALHVRPRELSLPRSNYELHRTPLPSDIVQGLLGNCWFLSALAVVAERPELIRNILMSEQVSHYGVYRIRLCVDGEWKVVIIDDYLPCNSYGCLVYSEAKRKQLWVPLIEKACAKLRGSYAALISGRTVEGLATLTGAPCEVIELQQGYYGAESFDPDVVWARLLTSKDAGFLMGASCGSSFMPQEEQLGRYQQVGLQPNHAYSVLNISEVLSHRLVQLRNPWGHFSWNGEWSDGWCGWTQELKAILLPHGSQEGIFWMSFTDFCKYFESVEVCKIRSGWYDTRVCGPIKTHASPKQFYIYRLLVAETTEIDLTLYQKGSRTENFTKVGTLDLCVTVCEDEQDGIGRLICSSGRSLKSFVNTTVVLEPGLYTVAATAFGHWGLNLQKSEIPGSVLAVHSAKQVAINRVSAPSFLLADILIKTVLKYGEQQEARNCMGLYYLNGSGIVVLVENWSEDSCILVHCDCSLSENVVSTRQTLETVDLVPPLHRQIVLVLTQLEPSHSYYISHKLSHKMSGYSGIGDWAPKDACRKENHWPVISEELFGLHGPRRII